MAMEYFPCYHSYGKKCEKLTDEELGRLFRALLRYSEGGEREELTGREAIAFDFICDDIDRARESYEARCEQNRRNAGKRRRAAAAQGAEAADMPGEDTETAASAEGAGTPAAPEETSATNASDGMPSTAIGSETGQSKDKSKSKTESKSKSEDKEDPPSVPPPEKAEAEELPPEGEDAGFSVFWRAYPRKTGGIERAYREYRAALEKGVTAEELLEAIAWQGEEWSATQEARYMPSAERWLKNRGWEARRGIGRAAGREGPPGGRSPEELGRLMEDLDRIFGKEE